MGSTESFLPGSWKAAPVVGESETAAAEPEAGPADGVPADPARVVGVEGVGVAGVGAGVVVTEPAAAEVVPDGTGTEEIPITTIGGDPDAEGERVDAEADADALTDTGTDETPITTMADEVGLEEAEVVTEEETVEDIGVVDAVEELVADDSDSVEEVVDTEEVTDEAEEVADEAEEVADAVELEAATVVDASLAPVLEGGIVTVVESAEVVDDDPLGSMVTVHVFTSRTASFP